MRNQRLFEFHNIGNVVAASALLLFSSFGLFATQINDIEPGPTLVADGIPKIPASLASSIKQYTTAYGLPVAAWNPSKHEVWLKDLANKMTVISRVAAPGDNRQTIGVIPIGGVYDLYFDPSRRHLVYNKDTDGNEAFQMYLYDLESHKTSVLTDGKSRNTEPVWSNKENRIVYSSSPVGGNGVSLFVMNPFEPESNRLLAKSAGTYFKAFDWSPNDTNVVFCDFASNATSTLWMIDTASGKKEQLSPSQADYYDSPQFSKDGTGIYVITDHESEIRRLAYIDLTTKKFKYVSSHVNWGVEEFKLSANGRQLAFITNEEGISRLHLLDVSSGKDVAVASLPSGIISDLTWRDDSNDLAFNVKTSHTPMDVYSINAETQKVEHWTQAQGVGVDVASIPDPELIRWKSFDNRIISGFLLRPPAKFTGKRPVVIEIHGGPEEQYRPSFWGQDNYLLNELGLVKIYPNIRGSSGYGKTFLSLDDGTKREDAVKDVGALLDWIKSQPSLDPERIMISGASYGGYISLSVATEYPGKIRTTQSIVGPTDLVTFLENTEGWRRDIRRAEYGDERDPRMHEYLENISPRKNAKKIISPLFIVQGQNDPRVKATEAEQLISLVRKNNIPVWYLLAKDEGHDFVNQRTIDFEFYATVLFIQQFLLR